MGWHACYTMPWRSHHALSAIVFAFCPPGIHHLPTISDLLALLAAMRSVCAEPLPMLKLKDFPPRSDFRNVMRRHYDDFVSLLNQ